MTQMPQLLKALQSYVESQEIFMNSTAVAHIEEQDE